MAHRKIILENAEWDVWDVRPQARLGAVGHGLENGWLCFQSGTRRRRLAPIPANWEDLSDAEVAELFARAREVRALLTDADENDRYQRLPDQRISHGPGDQRERGQRGA